MAGEKTPDQIYSEFSTLLDLHSKRVGESAETVSKMIEKIEKLHEELTEEKKEYRASRELLDDLVAEYDRLTERQSTQLRAQIEWFERLKKEI